MAQEQVTQNDIKKTIDKIRNADITHTNFDTWYERYDSKSEIIESNIASIAEEAKELQSQIKEREKQLDEKQLDFLNDSKDEKLDDLRKRFIKKQNEVVKWRNLQRKMESAMVESFHSALKAAKGMDIQKEVYNEFKSFHEEWMELNKGLAGDYKESVEKIADRYRKETKQELRRIESKQDESMEVMNNSISEIAESLAQLSVTIERDANEKEKLKEEIENKLSVDITSDREDDKPLEQEIDEPDEYDESENEEDDDLETDFEPVDGEEMEEVEEFDDLNDEENNRGEQNIDESESDVELPPDSFLIDEYLDNNVKETQDKIEQSNLAQYDEFLDKILDLEIEGKNRKTVRNHIQDLMRS